MRSSVHTVAFESQARRCVLCLFCALLAGAMAPAQGKGSSVKLPDGGFEEGDEKGQPLHWHRIEGKGAASLDAHERAQGASSLRLESPLGQELWIASEELDLEPLKRYRLELWVRRTQGNELSFCVEEKGPGTAYRHWLQLHWPGRYRPNWMSLYPGWRKYHAFFATGNKGASRRLVIRERCVNDRLGNGCRVDAASLTEIGDVTVAGIEEAPDELFPKDLAHFTPDEKGWPRAWGSWWGKRECARAVPGGAHEAGHRLEVRLGPKDGSLCLVVPSLPVEEGRLYRFCVRARGTGNVQMAIHQLGDAPFYWCRADTALRVGGSHPRDFRIDSEEWQRLEGEWIAEVPGMRWFNPYIVVSGEVDLSNASLR